MGNHHGKQKIIPFVDVDEAFGRDAKQQRIPHVKFLIETSKDLLDASVTTCNSDAGSRNNSSRQTSYRSEPTASGGNFMLTNPSHDYDAVLEEVKLRLKSKIPSQTLPRQDSRRRAFGGRSPSRRGTASPTQSFHGRPLDVIVDSGVELEESNNTTTESHNHWLKRSMEGLTFGLVSPLKSMAKVGIDAIDNVFDGNDEQMMDMTPEPESIMSHRHNALRDINGLITIPASSLGIDYVCGGVLLVPADDEYDASGVTKNATLLMKMKSTNADNRPYTRSTSGSNHSTTNHSNAKYQRRKSSFLTIIKPPVEKMGSSSHGSSASLCSIVDYFVGRSAH